MVKKRRMRRFNGTGSVYMLSGRRARPWVARIITGRDEHGKYSFAYTYHSNSTDASLAITDMQRDLEKSPQIDATIASMWERFKTVRYPKLSKSTVAGYNASYDHWSALHDKRISDIRTSDLQLVVNSQQEMSYSHLSKMRAIMVGGIKTQAGKNRVVPIHHSIRSIVSNWLDKENPTLFTDEKGLPLDKDKWGGRFSAVMKQIGIDNSIVPYTTRHTCASILHAAGADHLTIAKILGHKDYKITAMRYTHIDFNELETAINLLK